MSVVVRAKRFLRSPRTAVWLLGLVAVWMAIETGVPQGAITDPDVAAWRASYPLFAVLTSALGLHRAYVSPVFLGIVALLVVSTAVCATERTRHAMRAVRLSGSVDQQVLERLRTRPDLVIAVPESSADDVAWNEIAQALRGLRLRVRQGPRVTQGASGVYARLASSVFHWSLVGLILVISLGQLTRAEGLIGIPVGGSRPDLPGEYGLFVSGPLAGERSGIAIGVEEMPLRYEHGGVDRGAAPVVTLTGADGVELARGRVYPNNALRYGTTYVHMSDYGIALAVVISGEEGEMARIESLLDFDATTDDGTTTAELGLADDSERDVALARLSMPLDRTADGGIYANVPADPTIRIETVDLRTGEVASALVAPGETIEVVDGTMLVVEEVRHYARLSVIEDWSLPLVYAFLIAATLSVAIALLVPYRMVWVLRATASDGGPERLHIVIRHSRGDVRFADRVGRALAGTSGEDSREALAARTEESR